MMHKAPAISPKAISLTLASIGLGVSLAGLVFGVAASDVRPLLGYLMGLAYWLAPMIGLLVFTMLLYLFDAGWATIIRRQAEHLLGGLKWVALAFLPLLAIVWFSDSPGLLWKWLDTSSILATGGTVATDALYAHKSPFLNKEAFTIGSFVFIGVWIVLAEFFRRRSFAMDATPNERTYGLCRRVSALGIVLTALSLTFAAIYWLKSLEYHWFSTMYGVWFFAAGLFSAFALLIVVTRLSEASGTLKGLVSQSQYYLLGCLLLAFTIFWAYISFSQYLIIYSANIPEETFWYVLREVTTEGHFSSWGVLSVAGLLLGHFLLPFLALLFFYNKVKTNRLFGIAVWCLVFHAADIYWNILPAKLPTAAGDYIYRPFGISLWEVFTFLGLGGVIAASYFHSSSKRSALPKHDPRVKESLEYHL